MNRRNFRSFKSWALTGAAVAAIATPAYAQDARRFEIPQQSLIAALEAFGKQGDAEIVFSRAATEGRSTSGVTGEYEPAQALSMLLDGSGLRYRQVNANTYVVEAQSPQGGSAAGGGATVEALIVTAQKREEDIQDVPIAISAFSQEDLTRSQVAGGPDLMTQVPNMTFTKTNFSSYSIQIRGIGTQAISATTDPAVAVAFNNTPFIRNRFFEQEFYDLQRVEVLRGPQGTLYGRNATAGVVNIISAKPKFYVEAKASADISNYNSSRIEAMVNVPLVEDAVALRVAGAWTKRDGYAFNELTGGPIDGRDLWSTRVSLRISPNDRIDANLIWEHFEEDDDRLRSGKQLCHKDVVTEVGGLPVTYFQTLPDNGQPALFAGVQALFSQGCARGSLYSPDAFQTPNGLMLPYYLPLSALNLPAALSDPYLSTVQSKNLRVIESTIDPDYRAKSNIAELQVSFDFTDELTLTSETSYGTDTIFSLQDFNRFNTAPGAWEQDTRREDALIPGEFGGIFCDPQLGCSDRLVAVDVSSAKSRQFSEELRLSSDFDGAFNFSLGANYLRYDTEDKYYVFVNSLTLSAANAVPLNSGDVRSAPPYVGGVTTNLECLQNGYLPGDPENVYAVGQCQYIETNSIYEIQDMGHNYFLSRNPYKLISYAVFGEAYYKISDNLKVTAGLRWTVDKKDAPRIPSQILASQSVGYPVAEVIEQEWREPTGRLTIDWKPDLSFTDETLLYASYAHGYKAGGANPPGFVRVYYANDAVARNPNVASATRPKIFDPEFVDAYEVGAKNTLFDGRITANLAAFYYDYKGYQVSEIVDRSAYNRNFDTEVWGAELEADWRPLENLKFGLKGGYQKTRIADDTWVIDLMDRTAGDPDYLLVRPFPTQASSCILPVYAYVRDGELRGVGNPGGGGPGGCEWAYSYGVDPVTQLPYVPDPTVTAGKTIPAGYPGFNPEDPYVNNGEGITKNIGGNELPNAPNWTWTLTGDYTLPLAGDWLVNLHTDIHWQGQSYWRVFQDSDFSILDEYYAVNLAAIFTNEEAGWNVMAYVKNVTDEDAITGAFLLSDDTALVTNVFMIEPRLYGLRVTKTWSGGSTLGSFGERRDGPALWTVELGGQIQRHDAPNALYRPDFMDDFAAAMIDVSGKQDDDLDWGDGREVKITYAPSDWKVSLAVRRGETNGGDRVLVEGVSFDTCLFFSPCTNNTLQQFTFTNYGVSDLSEGEEHVLVDFTIGRNVGLGFGIASALSAGIRYAELKAETGVSLYGTPDWQIEPDCFSGAVAFLCPPHPTLRHLYEGAVEIDREFRGAGPTANWDASARLFESGGGRFDLDWSVSGGVLFGKQETRVEGVESAAYYSRTREEIMAFEPPVTLDTTPVSIVRSDDVTVPTLGASLGLSYAIGGFKTGIGYRWERYYDAIDGGVAAQQSYDRTIDGPYFKLAIGFGG